MFEWYYIYVQWYGSVCVVGVKGRMFDGVHGA